MEHGVASYKFQYKVSTSSSWITAATIDSFSSQEAIIRYTYTGLPLLLDKDYNIRVIITDRAGNTKISSILTDSTKSLSIADIGKTVTGYNPSGTYLKATLDTYSGVTVNKAFTTEDLGWKIWNIDNEYLYLISAKPTTQKLTLNGALGYNNGVTLLDEICSTCYQENYTGIEVRNIRISDLEKTITVTLQSSTTGYFATNSYCPSIFVLESESGLTTLANRESTPELTTDTFASPPKSAKSYYFSSTPGGFTGKYCTLMGTAASWLGTRQNLNSYSANTGTYTHQFGLAYWRDWDTYGSITSQNLCYSNGSASAAAFGLRPFVRIPLSSLEASWDENRTIMSISAI